LEDGSGVAVVVVPVPSGVEKTAVALFGFDKVAKLLGANALALLNNVVARTTT
jgi:hypothetical protein